MNKINKPVKFDLELNMKSHVADGVEPKNYKLKAVIAHKGETIDSGHYVCYLKNNSKWFCMDDSIVSLSDEKEVV